MKKLLILFTFLMVGVSVFADAFVPDFTTMKVLKCEISETVYNQDNSVVVQNKYHRVFRLDDENRQIYLQKAPVDSISTYDDGQIQMYIQTLTDDSIISENITLNRFDNTYKGVSQITYDNEILGVRHAQSEGLCTLVD